MFSTPSRAHPSAAPALDPPPTHADPLVGLWFEAVARYESETHVKLSSPAASSPNTLDSADAIFNFVNDHEATFKAFRKDGALHLSGRLRHIVSVVGTLSSSIGEGVGVPFAPGKAIFAAIGELVKAALAVRDDFDAIYAAFDTMEQQLRIIQPAVGEDINSSLRDPSVKLLAQILRVLGVITKLQQDGRFRTWLKKLAQSKTVSDALNDLRRLATNHHQAVSAVTLTTAQKTLAVLMDGVKGAAQDQDINQRCLASIAQLAQDVYEEILRSSSVTSKEILDIHGSLENIHSALRNHVASVDNNKRSTDMARICSWLQYQDCSPRLNDLLHHRVPSTGAWFLDGADFAALKSGLKRALWLQGKAGSGKSTLIAGAIQILRAYCFSQDPQPLVLQHFFDATNGSHYRNLRALYASLLCQLAQFSNESLSVLSDTREDHMSGNSQPSLDTLQNQLSGLLDNLPGPVFIVVDALDEADDTDVITLLEHLRTRPDVRLLLSSRGEVLFYDRLDDLCDRTIIIWDGLVKDDIGAVIQGAFNQGGPLVRMAMNDIDLTREALGSGADGSFRWTLLQIQALSSISGIPRKVRQKLKTLPKTLSEAYEQCLQAIQPEDRADVRILLTWLLMSYEPLSTREFALLLSFDYSERIPVFDASLKPSPMDMLALVGSTFISIHNSLMPVVRFSHASVRDFLLALPPTSEFHIDAGLAYALMARTGIAYMSATSSWNPRSQLSPGWMRYVDMAGSYHYDELESDITMAISNAPSTRGVDGALCDALHIAAETGHVRLIKLLYDKGRGTNVNALWHPETALYKAIRDDQHEVALLLIELGASGIPQDRYDSALHIATKRGHQGIVKALLDHSSVDVNVRSLYSGTALHVAAFHGHYDVAALLISRGADVSDHRGRHGETPLHYAVEQGYKDIAELLLNQQGVEIDACSGWGITALLKAVLNGKYDIAALLIARGADVGARTNDRLQLHSLHIAAHNGKRSIASLLLNQPGVDIEARDKRGWTALHHAASRNNHVGVASLLIGQGADTNTRGHDDWTALHIAVGINPYNRFGDGDRDHIVQLLLDSGADIEARESTRGSTSLHIASERGYVNCIRLLCERGAMKESRDDKGRTPLCWAVYSNREQAVRTLLDLGADATTLAYDGTSPLDVIGRNARHRDAEIEERIRAMLLRAGARDSAPQVVVSTVQDEGGGEAEEEQSEGDGSVQWQ